MKISNLTIIAGGLMLLAACAEEVPPVSVAQFMEKPRLLEAAMVRCSQNRAELKYDAECLNAREAVNRHASADEQGRRQRLDAQSDRKRQALRQNQEAAADARRRALEAQRQREEAEYLGLFEQLPADNGGQQNPAPSQQSSAQSGSTVPPTTVASPALANPAAAAPVETEAAITEVPVSEPAASDLQSIREELRRRREEPPQ